VSLRIRPRLLLALWASSLITLLVAAAVLLPALKTRLESQASEELERSASSTMFELAGDLRHERSTVKRGYVGPRTYGTLLALAQRTGARVVLTDITGQRRLFDSQTTPDDNRDIIRVVALNVPTKSSEAGTVRLAFAIDNSTKRDPTAFYVLALRKPTTDVDGAVGVVRDRLLLAALIGFLIACALGYLISATLTRRLRRLRRAALHLVDEGLAGKIPDDDGRDEIGDLARSLRSMQRSLERQEGARRRFTAVASHELRTPLTSLAGMLELLEEDLDDGLTDPIDAKDQVAAARAQVARLETLATELLDLSRLDAGERLRAERMELGELARAVVSEFTSRAARVALTIEIDPGYGQCWVNSDPGATARIVRILLDNALRFSPPNTTIHVAVEWAEKRASLSVTDEGPGVPEPDRERIFDRFMRGANAGGSGGFGLGLAIGRELAERLDGQLALDQDRAGRTRFVLQLPTVTPIPEPAH
jgi:signal transduction histidine kinase